MQSWDSKTITVRLREDYVQEGPCPTFVLPHKKAAEILRLQHALVYASIQGRTFRDQHIVLLDLQSPRVTMRDTITAMSRPTNGRFLHFPTQVEEAVWESRRGVLC